MLEAAILVIGCAGALRGYHQGAERRLGGARRPEDFALPGLDRALEHLAALAGLWIGDPDVGYRELSFGVEAGIFVAQLDAGMIDRSEAPPLEKLTQFVNARDRSQCGRIAVFGNDARVLIFDLRSALFDLPHHHPYRLQNIQRFEAGDDHRLAIELWR